MDYKKIRDKLKVIVSIILLVWAIYVMVEIIRIKNNLSSSPLIVLTEESTYNDYTYYSLGFKTEYIYKDGKKNRAIFKLFNIITIWDVEYEEWYEKDYISNNIIINN